MQVAFCAFDDMTALDFVGTYDAVTRLDRMDIADLSWDVCGPSVSVCASGLRLEVDRVMPELGSYDLVFVPGGSGVDAMIENEESLAWIAGATAARYVSSVCTGSVILGAAGVLEQVVATTHPTARDRLAEYTTVVDERIVHDGTVITGAGVSASIDLGLYLVSQLAGDAARETIATQMDYPYGPPAVHRV